MFAFWKNLHNALNNVPLSSESTKRSTEAIGLRLRLLICIAGSGVSYLNILSWFLCSCHVSCCSFALTLLLLLAADCVHLCCCRYELLLCAQCEIVCRHPSHVPVDVPDLFPALTLQCCFVDSVSNLPALLTTFVVSLPTEYWIVDYYHWFFPFVLRKGSWQQVNRSFWTSSL